MKSTLAIVAFFLPVIACAQLTINIPQQRYKPHEQIDVVITNTGDRDLTYCTEFGHWSFPTEQHLETTPTPVYVQKKDQHGWSTLIIGPDVGSSRKEETLSPGESRHYPFRLTAPGRLRILLDYWIGGGVPACSNPKGSRRAKSREFIIK